MDGGWSVLGALKAGRERVIAGASVSALSAIRALRAEVPPPVRDQAYYLLLETATRRGEQPSLAMLAGQPHEATVALFDAAIRQLSAKLH